MAYTAKKIMEAVLTELNKVNAPSILLDDFNYFFNKAILLFVNKQYNIYDVNLLTTDNMRVLKAGALLKPRKAFDYANYEGGESGVFGDDVKMLDSLYGATYEVDLPDDYFHLLNCVCIYKLKKRNGCHNAGDYWSVAALRLTADLWAGVLNNLYARPLPKRPYYYIHNVNASADRPTNPIVLDSDGQIIKGTDVTPSTTYTFLLDRFTNEFASNGGLLPLQITSTKKVNNLPEENVSYTYTVRGGNNWLNVTENNGMLTVTASLNASSTDRYAYIDFTLQESHNTITFTAIQKAAQQQVVGGAIYFGKGNMIPSTETDIINGTQRFMNANPYILTLDAYNAHVVWFALKKGTGTVTSVTDLLNVNVLPTGAIHDIEVGNYTVYYNGNPSGPFINNTYKATIQH